MDCSYRALIEAKKTGRELHPEQIEAFAVCVRDKTWPDYQIAALLMAIRLRGMTDAETVALTMAMARHSDRLQGRMGGFVVDKHSTGGVGDGTSLVLAPWAASLGLIVPMMSGRSLGFTGGTLDKLESVPGFSTQLSKQVFTRQVKRLGVAMFGQTSDLAPVDRKLYALRDAISAVDSQPLVVSSIVSKKLIEGLDGLVFDVKFGRGAIFEDPQQARRLAKNLVGVARAAGLKARAVLSRMEEPLGRSVGNAIEMEQAWEILSGRTQGLEDFVDLTLTLLYHMLNLAGLAKTKNQAREMAMEALHSGRALDKFKKMLAAQGAVKAAWQNLPPRLPRAKKSWQIEAPRSGWISFVDARKIAESSLYLGALRRRVEDHVDFTAGLRLFKKSGEKVLKGEALACLYTSVALSEECKIAESFAKEAFRISAARPKIRPVVVYDGF